MVFAVKNEIFEIPVATPADMAEGTTNDRVVTPALLGSAANRDEGDFQPASVNLGTYASVTPGAAGLSILAEEKKSAILENLEIDRSPHALPRSPVYTPTTSSAFTRTLFNGNTENGGSTVYHRHFGSVVVDHRGIIHGVHRRALGHAGYFSGVICHYTLDHNGNERSAEKVILSPASPNGFDLHSPMLLVLPNGRILLTYTELNTSGSGGACIFKCVHSDDFAESWSEPAVIDTKTQARLFGQPRVVPSSVAGERWMILQPWYGLDETGTFRRLGLYESHDSVTWAEKSVPIYQGSDMDLNEASIAILTARVWFAAIRKNGARLHWSVTTDAGGAWTTPVQASWGSTLDVAPSLDVLTVGGVDHLLLGYCDRQSDQTKWRWAKASKLMVNAEAMGSTLAVTSAADMGSASGYQVPVIYPNGQMLFAEFREYAYNTTISDPVGTDVRIVWASPAEWISGRQFTWVPEMAGKTTPGTPTFDTRSGYVSTDPSGRVLVNMRLGLLSKGGMVGALTITNLPRKIKNASAAQPVARVFVGLGGITGGSTYTEVNAIGILNSNSLDLYKFVPGSGHLALLATDITDGANIYITLDYLTDE